MSEVLAAGTPWLPSHIDVALHHDFGSTKRRRPTTAAAAAMAFGYASTGAEREVAHRVGSRSQVGLQRFEDVDGNTGRALVVAAYENIVGQRVGSLELDLVGLVLVQRSFPIGERIGVVVEKVVALGYYLSIVVKNSETAAWPTVVRSLEEAGNQLLTFYEFPSVMWKSIRTTNALENLNREFRRRTKTQASFSSEESAVALLFGLIASGQIQLRRIDGYQGLSEVLEHAEVAA